MKVLATVFLMVLAIGCSSGGDEDSDPVAPQPDSDGDTIANVFDNCAGTANATQANQDGDSRGDVCDNCPAVVNSSQQDTDGDGTGDACEP